MVVGAPPVAMKRQRPASAPGARQQSARFEARPLPQKALSYLSGQCNADLAAAAQGTVAKATQAGQRQYSAGSSTRVPSQRSTSKASRLTRRPASAGSTAASSGLQRSASASSTSLPRSANNQSSLTRSATSKGKLTACQAPARPSDNQFAPECVKTASVYLREAKQRHWIRSRQRNASTQNVAMAQRERVKRVFDAITDGHETMDMSVLEDLFVLLGVANNEFDVAKMVTPIKSIRDHQLYFEDFLQLVQQFPLQVDILEGIKDIWRSRPQPSDGPARFNDLLKPADFQTVCAAYYRQLILGTVVIVQPGSRPTCVSKVTSKAVVENYEALRLRRPGFLHKMVRNVDAVDAAVDAEVATHNRLSPIWERTCQRLGLLDEDSAQGSPFWREVVPKSPRSVLDQFMVTIREDWSSPTKTHKTIVVPAPKVR